MYQRFGFATEDLQPKSMFACVFGHGCNSRFGFVVARTQSYLTGRAADF
jgi:hypothetical protein